METRFLHGSPTLVVGPSCCGKTDFLKRVAEHPSHFVTPSPNKVVWCGNSTDEIRVGDVPIEFLSEMPTDFEGYSNSLIILDDMLLEVFDDTNVANLFIRDCHHKKITLFVTLQNLFSNAKYQRTCSLNAKYILLYNSPRDKLQIQTLCRQLEPTKWRSLLKAYEDACSPYNFLLIDLNQETPADFKYRTGYNNGEISAYRLNVEKTI